MLHRIRAANVTVKNCISFIFYRLERGWKVQWGDLESHLWNGTRLLHLHSKLGSSASQPHLSSSKCRKMSEVHLSKYGLLN